MSQIDQVHGQVSGRVYRYEDVAIKRFTYTSLVIFIGGGIKDVYVEFHVPKSYDGEEPQKGDDVTVSYSVSGKLWGDEEKVFNTLYVEEITIDENAYDTHVSDKQKPVGSNEQDIPF